jgi:hypothetical protein
VNETKTTDLIALVAVCVLAFAVGLCMRPYIDREWVPHVADGVTGYTCEVRR